MAGRTCTVCGQPYQSWVNGRGEPTTAKCPPCREKAIQAALRKGLEAKLPEIEGAQRAVWRQKCGLAGLFAEKTLANFERRLQPKAYDAVKAYQGGSLALLSPDLYGVGKTHLAAALVNRLIAERPAVVLDERNHYVRFPPPARIISEGSLLGGIRATYRAPNSSEEDIYNELAGYHLLIIDDVGKVRPSDLRFLQGVYYRIIDERYRLRRDLVLTTNLSPSDLEAHLGGASSDRLHEMCGGQFIRLGGRSYRQGHGR